MSEQELLNLYQTYDKILRTIYDNKQNNNFTFSGVCNLSNIKLDYIDLKLYIDKFEEDLQQTMLL